MERLILQSVGRSYHSLGIWKPLLLGLERPIPLINEEVTFTCGRDTSSTGKEDSLVLRCSVSIASLGSSFVSLPQFIGSHLLPINDLTLTMDTLWDWKFYLCCNSDLLSHLVFNNFSPVTEKLSFIIQDKIRKVFILKKKKKNRENLSVADLCWPKAKGICLIPGEVKPYFKAYPQEGMKERNW